MDLRIPGRKTLVALIALLLLGWQTTVIHAQSEPISPQPPIGGTIPLPAVKSPGLEFTGLLSVLHGDDFATGAHTVAYSLTLDDSSDISLDIDHAQFPDGISLQSVAGKRTIVTGEWIADGDGNTSHALFGVHTLRPVDEITAADAEVTGTLRYANLLCLFPDTGIEPENSAAEIAAFFDNSADSVPAFFKTSSYGKLTIEFTTVTAWRTMPISAADYPDDSARRNVVNSYCPDLFLDQIDFSNYDGVQFFINDDWENAAGYGGTGIVKWAGKSKSMRATWFVSWHIGTILHEIGHSIGMPHTDNADGDSSTYDGYWDIMSGGDADFLALHKSVQGWIPPEKVRVLGNEASVVIDLSWQHLADKSSQPALIKIPTGKDNDYYSVEAQTFPEPTYYRDPPGTLKGVLVFAVDEYDFRTPIVQVGSYSDYGGLYGPGALRTGDMYVNRANRFFVEVLQESSSGVRVRVGRLTAVPTTAPDLRMSITPMTDRTGESAFTVKITNAGNGVASSVFVELTGTYRFTASDGKEYTTYFSTLPSPLAPPWKCEEIARRTFCKVGNIAPGATVSAVVSKVAQYKTTYNLEGAAFAVTEESDLANNLAKSSAQFSPAPDLTVLIEMESLEALPEFTVIFATVKNTGYADVSASLAITVPVGLEIISQDYSNDEVKCTASGQVWLCTLGTIRPGWTHSVSVVVTEGENLKPGKHEVVARVWAPAAVKEISLTNNSAKALYCTADCPTPPPPVTCTNCSRPYFLPAIVRQ